MPVAAVYRGHVIWYQNLEELFLNAHKFECWTNLCLWQLLKEGNHQGILANFAPPFFKPP